MPKSFSNWIRRHALLGLLLMTTAVWAGTTYADYLRSLAQRESSMNQYAVNQYGYAGLYQMGTAALQDAGYKNASGAWTGKDGITSQAQFLANAQAQTNAVTAYHTKAWQTIQHYGLDKYIGQTVNGVEITASGLLGGYHLLGIGNAKSPGLKAFLQGGVIGTDANNTSIASYIAKFAGYGLPTATTYADVLAAKPSGGVATSKTTAGSGASTALPGSLTGSSVLTSSSTGSASTYANPMDGFAGGSGSSMGDTRNMLTLVAAAALLTWLAYVVFVSWSAFADGRTELNEMGGDIVRGMVVAMLVILILW
jgi:hypothetical protein